MPAQSLYPLKLQPSLHVKVWGGRQLATRLNKRLPDAEPYGEAWELHGGSRVMQGPLRGHSLQRLTADYGEDLLGKGSDPAAGFPLLAKFIDADDWLSIQVHPDDAQAMALEGEPRGKTEAWLILRAKPGAKLVIGLKPGQSRHDLAAAISEDRLEALLAYAPVQAGDLLYMPANTIHALGPGILLYEIQQASDITYRLYDWGRLGLDGQARELHINKSLQVAKLDALPQVQRPSGDLLVDSPYFQAWRHELREEGLRLATQGRFQALSCIAGAPRIETDGHEPLELALGETCLIPACIDALDIRGHGIVLRACPPAY